MDLKFGAKAVQKQRAKFHSEPHGDPQADMAAVKNRAWNFTSR